MGVELRRRTVRGPCAFAARLLLTAGLALLAACAGSSDYMKEAPPPSFEPVAGMATVHFLRPSGYGSSINFQIWDRDRFLGLAQAKCYFMVQLPPGKHLFIATAENKVGVTADLAAGKRYFVLLEARMGGLRARAAMTAVMKGSEEWDTVESTRADLYYVVPLEKEIRGWESAHRDEATKLVTFFETAPDREKYLSHLAASDGR